MPPFSFDLPRPGQGIIPGSEYFAGEDPARRHRERPARAVFYFSRRNTRWPNRKPPSPTEGDEGAGQKDPHGDGVRLPTGILVDQTDIELILVGDSLGMVMLGYDGTVPVTMEEMIHHCKATVRGAKNTLIVGDMPFGSYNTSVSDAVYNATRLMKEGGVDCVKLEGGLNVVETVRAIVAGGIPVMAHIGLTPQTASALGGFKVQGKDAAAAERMVTEALKLEEAGAFAIVLEAIPAPLAEIITKKLTIPTIGIGAGVHCDGQCW
jgi:3-methyl-2-oxobutanoate hydroxymethyltransferase